MKWLIAAWLALTVSLVHAVECGPLIAQSKVKALEKSLSDNRIRLRQHQEVLLNESSRLLAGASSEASQLEFQKLGLEIDRLTFSSNGGEQIESLLDATAMLASIRDSMVDKQDKFIVERYLSLYAVHVKNTAEINHRGISNMLTQVSRPGVAIDVSKLRDVIGTVVGEFQRCETPKSPSRRAPIVQ